MFRVVETNGKNVYISFSYLPFYPGALHHILQKTWDFIHRKQLYFDERKMHGQQQEWSSYGFNRRRVALFRIRRMYANKQNRAGAIFSEDWRALIATVDVPSVRTEPSGTTATAGFYESLTSPKRRQIARMSIARTSKNQTHTAKQVHTSPKSTPPSQLSTSGITEPRNFVTNAAPSKYTRAGLYCRQHVTMNALELIELAKCATAFCSILKSNGYSPEKEEQTKICFVTVTHFY